MKIPDPVDFPYLTNNQQNILQVKDKVNEIIAYLAEKGSGTTDAVEGIIQNNCTHANSYSMNRNNMWRCKDCKKTFKKEA
jgi:hypothetical protein